MSLAQNTLNLMEKIPDEPYIQPTKSIPLGDFTDGIAKGITKGADYVHETARGFWGQYIGLDLGGWDALGNIIDHTQNLLSTVLPDGVLEKIPNLPPIGAKEWDLLGLPISALAKGLISGRKLGKADGGLFSLEGFLHGTRDSLIPDSAWGKFLVGSFSVFALTAGFGPTGYTTAMAVRNIAKPILFAKPAEYADDKQIEFTMQRIMNTANQEMYGANHHIPGTSKGIGRRGIVEGKKYNLAQKRKAFKRNPSPNRSDYMSARTEYYGNGTEEEKGNTERELKEKYHDFLTNPTDTNALSDFERALDNYKEKCGLSRWYKFIKKAYRKSKNWKST